MKIPKIIHYCWFGGKEKPKLAKRCLESWLKYFPEYEIKEWNEGNFDVNITPFTKDAYASKKYAFVSDYARFWILYHYGGIYFDTDVEVIKPMDHIIANGPFLGLEVDPFLHKWMGINPGLGMGAFPKMDIYLQMLKLYESLSFRTKDSDLPNSVVVNTRDILEQNGLKFTNKIQIVKGITIYPKDYFCPLDETMGKLFITENTVSIHWFNKSWIPTHHRVKAKIGQFLRQIFGGNNITKIKRSIKI